MQSCWFGGLSARCKAIRLIVVDDLADQLLLLPPGLTEHLQAAWHVRHAKSQATRVVP